LSQDKKQRSETPLEPFKNQNSYQSIKTHIKRFYGLLDTLKLILWFYA